MGYLRAHYDKHPFFDGPLESRQKTLDCVRYFLDKLGLDGQMMLAAVVLSEDTETGVLARALGRKYGLWDWTERHVEFGFTLMIANECAFRYIFTKCQQNQNWKEYDTVLRIAYNNINFEGKQKNPTFQRNPEKLAFLFNQKFADEDIPEEPPSKFVKLS